MTAPWRSRATLLVAGGLVVSYAVALLVVPSRFMTTDAAKYVGVGRNMLTGAGPVTSFGTFFPYHSPTWPIVVMGPEALAGIDWALWSRFLNIAGAVAVVVMTGYLAWRFSPRAALLAVALIVAFRYGFELARTLGLDEAAAATTLLFVVLAVQAGTRRPTSWAILLGLSFGVAFLVKEITLTLAPLPVLVVLLAGCGWRVALRLLGTYAAVAFAVTAWWFVMYAGYTGTVYRLGTPAWTLVAIAIAIGGLFLAGRMFGRETPDGSGSAASRTRERALAWATALGWALVLAGFFQLSQHGTGASLLRPGQYAFYLDVWGLALLPVGGVAAVGAAIATWERARGRLEAAQALRVDALLLALLLSVPLVLLVVAVGEKPRHFLAQVPVLVALGAFGWDRLLGGVVARLARRPGRVANAARWVAPIVLVVCVTTSGLLLARAVRQDVRARDLRTDQVQAAAVSEIGDWLATNVRAGETVAMGSILNYQLATRIPAGSMARIVREDQNVQPRPGSPLGVGHGSETSEDDWIALMPDPHDATSFYGYQRSAVAAKLRDLGVDVWIQGDVTPVGSSPPIVAALDSMTGLEREASWTYPYGRGREIRVTAYRVNDPDGGAAGNGLYLSGATLERLVTALEAEPAAGAASAGNLLGRVVLVDGDRDDLMGRLRALAGG